MFQSDLENFTMNILSWTLTFLGLIHLLYSQQVSASSFFNYTRLSPQFDAFKSSTIGKFLLSSICSGLFPHPFLLSRVSTFALKDASDSDISSVPISSCLDDVNDVECEAREFESEKLVDTFTSSKDQPESVYLQDTHLLQLGDVLSDKSDNFFFFVSTVKGSQNKCNLADLNTGYVLFDECIYKLKLVKPVNPKDLEYLDYSNDQEIGDIFTVYQKFNGKYLMRSAERLIHFVAPIDTFDQFVRSEFLSRLEQNKIKNVLLPKVAKNKNDTVFSNNYNANYGVDGPANPSPDGDSGNVSPDSIVEYWSKGKSKEEDMVKIFKLMFLVGREYTDELSNDRMDYIKFKIIPDFLKSKHLPIELAKYVVKSAESIFLQELVVNYVTLSEQGNINIFGDIHGQFEDLIRELQRIGFPTSTNMLLFNGDIVDRGEQSIECLLLILLLKITFPDYVFVNRGNHESRSCSPCKFYLECQKIYDGGSKSVQVDKNTKKLKMGFFDTCHIFFESLPVAHVINSKIYVVHGGIMSDLRIGNISKMNKLFPGKYLTTYIHLSMWYDPSEEAGITPNLQRGANVQCFGPDVTRAFLDLNKFDLIIRSHTLVNEGYQEMHDGKCLTVFSAPRYCKGNNKAAVIRINHKLERTVLYFK